MTNVIVVSSLIKRYDRRAPILNGVTFSIREGEFAAIFGKSGCGKTTLLNMLGGLDRPTEGKVEVAGMDISAMNEDQLALFRLDNVGFVFQDYNLIEELTVRENILLPARFRGKGVDDRRAGELMEVFDIAGIADEKANRISGGEAQRTAIARAMMNGPKIILADEPTGNLDRENAGNVMKLFRLAKQNYGTTIILATHDSELARFASMRLKLANGIIKLETQS